MCIRDRARPGYFRLQSAEWHGRSRGGGRATREAADVYKRQLMNSEDHDRNLPAANERNWRRIHHSPAFWVGLVLCLAAITIYVWSDDLSWRPRIQ